ncbi:MAG TPA: YSC84-related protein [Patescibacteria group bacterium]|nr:YSC84-related protein [Patescibacteria group bacterium]
MKKKWSLLVTTLMVLSLLAGTASAASVEEKRQDVRNLSQRILTKLYQDHPSAKGAIQSSAGYATFGNTGFKLGFIGSGHGRGLAVNNSSGAEYFMSMFEVGIGLGLGVKETSVIFLFDNEEAFQNFVAEGWEFGGQAGLTATDSVSGGSLEGAVCVAPHVWVYQMTSKGLAAEITLNGTKYSIDKDLK